MYIGKVHYTFYQGCDVPVTMVTDIQITYTALKYLSFRNHTQVH